MEKNIMRPRGFRSKKREKKEFDERVVEVSRVSRVVKGGRRIRFRALVVIGNRKGRVGMGIGKANEVANAVKKGTSQAKKNIVTVPIIAGTIPYELTATFGASRVVLKPASPGTSIVAGSSVRTVIELVGITDILSKILGSKNKINNVIATIRALSSFNPNLVRRIEEFEEKSAKTLIKSDKSQPIQSEHSKNNDKDSESVKTKKVDNKVKKSINKK